MHSGFLVECGCEWVFYFILFCCFSETFVFVLDVLNGKSIYEWAKYAKQMNLKAIPIQLKRGARVIVLRMCISVCMTAM